jgi:predicted component of type VI protein secretion system
MLNLGNFDKCIADLSQTYFFFFLLKGNNLNPFSAFVMVFIYMEMFVSLQLNHETHI